MTGWRGEGLTVTRGGRNLLDGVTVHLPAGRVTALVGPNGSGKTTLLRVLSGLVRPEGGRVAGGTTAGWREPDWARTVACVFGALAEDLPYCVEEVLLSALFRESGRWVEPTPELRTRLATLLDRLEVFPDGARRGLEREYASLSAGERQLVDLARGLLQPTPVLLLDEPTSALDVRHRLLVRQVLRDEAAAGRTVAASLHDLAEVGAGVDAVCVLHRGRVAAVGSPEAELTPGLLARVWGVTPAAGGFQLI